MSASRPNVADSLSKILNRARSRGPSEAAGALWDQLRSSIRSDGRLLVLTRPSGGTAELRPDLTFREADLSDAAAYARHIGTDSVRTFRGRLSEETRCYLVESSGRLLHASWVTTGSAWTAELKTFVCPPDGDAYIYESFTRPETRGRGIYPFALRNICRVLAERDIGRAWIAVEATNAPSVRAITKAGFEPAFELAFHRRWLKVQVEAPSGPHPELATGFVSPLSPG